MFGIGSLFGWIQKIEWLQKLLKVIPGISQAMQLIQAAMQFVRALAAGNIKAAFMSLIGPALQIALSMIPAVGSALGQVGDMLADQLDKVLGPVMDQLTAQLGGAAADAISKQLTDFETYLRSDAFTKALSNYLGKDATAVITTGDMSKLANGDFFQSIMSGYISTEGLSYLKGAFPSTNGSSALSTYSPSITATIPLVPLQNYVPSVGSASSVTDSTEYTPFTDGFGPSSQLKDLTVGSAKA
jgi:hypothetical protein